MIRRPILSAGMLLLAVLPAHAQSCSELCADLRSFSVNDCRGKHQDLSSRMDIDEMRQCLEDAEDVYKSASSLFEVGRVTRK